MTNPRRARPKRSGWAHPIETSSRTNLKRRILTGRRRATHLFRLRRHELADHDARQQVDEAA